MPKFCKDCKSCEGKVKSWRNRIRCSNAELVKTLDERYLDEFIVNGDIEIEQDLKTKHEYLECDYFEEREQKDLTL